MHAKPKLYEVGCQITEYRSIAVWATNQADAVAKAQALDQIDPELFELSTGVPECWAAHLMEA